MPLHHSLANIAHVRTVAVIIIWSVCPSYTYSGISVETVKPNKISYNNTIKNDQFNILKSTNQYHNYHDATLKHESEGDNTTTKTLFTKLLDETSYNELKNIKLKALNKNQSNYHRSKRSLQNKQLFRETLQSETGILRNEFLNLSDILRSGITNIKKENQDKDKLAEDIIYPTVNKKLNASESDSTDLLDYFSGIDYINSTEEPCVGDPEYCNMTREEYVNMLNDYIFPQSYEWVLIFTHAIVFIIGLIGNALVCIAVYRNHSMRTVTNYFIVNLAVADFMVILFCLPPTVLWDVTETWFFGNSMCRIVLYFQSVSVTVSVLTLTFISLDRWYAICFPLKFKSTTGRAKTAILIIWLASLLFNIPEFVVLQAQRKAPLRFDVQYFIQCTPTWSIESDLKWHIVKALFLYTFPLFLMMIAYCQIVRVLWRSDNIPGHSESHKYAPAGQNSWLQSRRTAPSIHANASTEGQLRSRRKAAKMLVAVVLMFAVCYFPVHLLSVLRYAFDMQQSDVMTFLALLSHVLCYANSAVNPLIYNFMSGKFRKEFHRSYFKCLCCCYDNDSPDRNNTSFAPISSSRAGTTKTIVRRNDSCVSYRLTHMPSNCNTNSVNRDFGRTSDTSFIDRSNGNRKPPNIIRNDSISESATRFTLTPDGAARD